MKPHHLFILFISVFALKTSAALSQEKNDKHYRFYDFNISLELLRFPYPHIEKNAYKDLDEAVLTKHSEWLYVIQNEGRYYDESAQKQNDIEMDIFMLYNT